jgi:hypothetical protein
LPWEDTSGFSKDTLRIHCKKRLTIFPSLAGMSLTKLFLGIIQLFLARESLISDILTGNGKIANLFYSVPANKWIS